MVRDQSLLIYKEWEKQYEDEIKLVILFVTDQDVERISTYIQCDRGKPKFVIVNDELVLTGIPVPNIFDEQPQEMTDVKAEQPLSLKMRTNRFLQYSRFFDAIYKRYARLRNKESAAENTKKHVPTESDPMLTARIFEELKKVVEKRGAEFLIIFAPSYKEVVRQPDYNPYQLQLIEICKGLGITYIDLAQRFISAGGESYIKNGHHWNIYGNKIGAEIIYNFLLTDTSLPDI